MAALTFILPSEVEDGIFLRDRIWTDVTYGVNFLLAAQQTNDDNNMRGAVPAKFPSRPQAAGDFLVRVDYVQHSMSAVIAYEREVLRREHEGGQEEAQQRSLRAPILKQHGKGHPAAAGGSRLSLKGLAASDMMGRNDGAGAFGNGTVSSLHIIAAIFGLIVVIIATFVIGRVYYPFLLRQRRIKRRD